MKLGFFFGAGAEIQYGMPSGGRFALDLFRHDVSPEKESLRDHLQQIDRRTIYAVDWLPDGFWDKRIHAFGKNEFVSLVESSIEYRKHIMIDRLNSLDVAAAKALQELGIQREHLATLYARDFEKAYGERLYSQVVKLNPMLADHVQLFGSEFYSAMLDIIAKPLPGSEEVQRYAASFLHLLVGAHGQNLVQRLNQEIFIEAPDNIPIFDDVSGMFRLEFSKAGVTALDILISEQPKYDVADNDLARLVCAVGHKILEELFSQVLDYQALIDSHFRYLFSPKKEWAKFTKMVIFLKAARKYIASEVGAMDELPEEGYYHDVVGAHQDGLEIGAVGTANYNSLFELVAQKNNLALEVHHLNGSVRDYYDPYKNSVVSCEPEEVPQEHIYVPFILTQSGLKPLTSVSMSRRYVKLFDELAQCDAIACIGYSFGIDDNHINGLFRELIEDKEKRLFWIVKGGPNEEEERRKQLVRSLRVSSTAGNRLQVVCIDGATRTHEEQLWIDVIQQRMQERGA